MADYTTYANAGQQSQAPPPPNYDEMGEITAQLAAAKRKQELAKALMASGYIPNSGALGVLASVFSAWKGGKLNREQDEKVSDALKRQLEQARVAKDYDRYQAIQDKIEEEKRASAARIAEKAAPDQNSGKPFTVAPGSVLIDPKTNQPIYSAPYKPDAPPDQKWTPVNVPTEDGGFKLMDFNPITREYREPNFGGGPQAAPPQGGGGGGGGGGGALTRGTAMDIVQKLEVQNGAPFDPKARLKMIDEIMSGAQFDTTDQAPGTPPPGIAAPPEQGTSPRLGIKPPAERKGASPAAEKQMGNALAVDAVRYAASMLNLSQAEVRAMQPEEIRDAIKNNAGRRYATGPVAGRVPGVNAFANADLDSYANSAAARVARINNPTGVVTNADQEVARKTVFSPEKPNNVNADLIYDALTWNEATPYARPEKKPAAAPTKAKAVHEMSDEEVLGGL